MARALAELIRSSEAINVIGLLGGWGSGKSTVVHQMGKELRPKDAKRLHLYTYDAWLHQNDPPRRAFIEALIEDLAGAKIIEVADWETRQAELAGRAEEIETTTTRTLTETGKWIFLALGFVPIGLGFLDYELISKAIGRDWSLLALGLLLLSLAMVSAPLLVVARFYWQWRPKPASWRKGGWKCLFTRKFWTKHAKEYEKQSLLALLTNHSVENVENKTKISPNPTAIEFRNIFNDLLKACHSKGKRLVIVIDNLDRLAEADAMQLWATIRSLFLGNNQIFANGTPRPPAIILPIDESAITRMFAATHADEAQLLSESFLDKTFDITFQVNEPVMSDWRQYLGDKMSEAFGTRITTEDMYWTEKILENQGDPALAGKILTPRKIIKYINAIGALATQWDDDAIAFPAMAIYCAHRSAIASGVRKFINREHPIFDAALSDWKRQVAALHFGVMPDKAYQAMLGGPLRDAIMAYDIDRFDELIASVGAPAVFEEVLAEREAITEGKVEGDFVANAALLAGKFVDDGAYWARHSLGRLSTMWLGATDISTWRPDFPLLIGRLRPGTSSRLSTFLDKCASQISAAIFFAKIEGLIAQEFAASLEALQKIATAEKRRLPSVMVEMEAASFLGLVPSLTYSLRPMVVSDQRAEAILEEIVKGLASQQRAATLPSLIVPLASTPAIRFADGTTIKWDKLAQTAFDMAASQPLKHFATGPALDLLGLLHSFNPLAKSLVQRSFDEGRLTTLLNEADGQGNMDRCADITALMLLREGDFSAPNGKSWEVIVRDNAAFAGRVHFSLWTYRWSNGATYLLERQRKLPSLRPLIVAVAIHDVTHRRSAGLSNRYLLDHGKALAEQIGAKLFGEALGIAVRRSDFIKALGETANGEAYEYAVRGLSGLAGVDRKLLVVDLQARLDAIDVAGWCSAIREADVGYGLAELYRVALGQSRSLGDNLKSALTEERSHVVEFGWPERRRWFELSRYLTKSARATLYKNLRDMLLAGGEVSALGELLQAGGEDFMRDGRFIDEADKTARHILLPLLALENGRAVAMTHGAYFAEIIAKSAKDTRTEIGELLVAAAENGAEANEIAALRVLLKL